MAFLVMAMLAGCSSAQPTDEYSRPTPGAALLVDATDAATVDRISERVLARLAREPALRTALLSEGHETATRYSISFRGSCAGQASFVAAMRAEIAKVTQARAICEDRP
ncbi:hypothetical protein [Sphingomonas jatrophae]|uniref:hypothetical protein n=1 Tax=Sphingomonas jatrophae TaxID=1166337 RepID=UPI000B877961|nr:hypothetical protein [Sphingomonas jatrophae]